MMSTAYDFALDVAQIAGLWTAAPVADAADGLLARVGRATGDRAEFRRPNGWSKLSTEGSLERLRAWREGEALAATLGEIVAVVDVDTKHGADVDKVRQLLDGLGVRIFAEVATPSGGRHFYVPGHPDLPTVHADGSRDAFAGYPGLEIISHGANVFLPGTKRPKYDGAGYEVLSNNLAALADGGDPDGAEALVGWVSQNRLTRAAEPFETAEPWTGRPPDSRERAYLAAMLDNISSRVAGQQTPGRNVALYEAALCCGNYIAGAGLDEREVISRLIDAANRCGLTGDDGERSVLATIKSGLTNGKARPRAVPDARGVVSEVSRLALAPAPPSGDATQAPDVFGSSWQPLELGDILAGLVSGTLRRLAPTVGKLEGAGHLLYSGKVNGIAGESGGGKTWTALAIVAQQIAAGATVIYIDLEDDAAGIVGRLLALGCDPDVVGELLVYISPTERLDDIARAGLRDLVEHRAPSLVVIDSTGEGLALEGANPNADEEVAAWFRRLPRHLAATGAAVLVLDHVTKSGEGGMWPIGSQRKRAAIDGAQYMQETVRPFSRDSAGHAVLKCAKDRHGTYRTGQRVAELHVAPDEAAVHATLKAAEPLKDGSGLFRPTGYMERVSKILEIAGSALTYNEIRNRVAGKKEHVRAAVDALIADGFVTTQAGPNRSVQHSLRKPFREAGTTDPGEVTPEGGPGGPGPRNGDRGTTGMTGPGDHSGTTGDHRDSQSAQAVLTNLLGAVEIADEEAS